VLNEVADALLVRLATVADAVELVDAVRLTVPLDEVWPSKLSSAWVMAFSASTRVVRLWVEAEVVLSVVAAVEPVDEVDEAEEVSSCSEVRKARAAAANLSDGPPLGGGGGGGGPDRLVALWVLVEALFCPVGSVLFAALAPLLCMAANSACSVSRAELFELLDICIVGPLRWALSAANFSQSARRLSHYGDRECNGWAILNIDMGLTDLC